jgi:hypothetical protein
MLRQRLFLGCVAICIVIVCVIIRSLALGWLLVLFGIAYLPLLALHVFIHARYAAILTPKVSTVIAITASHLAVVLAFLFQRDFTDTPYAITPFTELLKLPPPRFQGGGSEMVFDVMLFLPACIL